ncbi:uncharacterized protein N7483_007689 [Penicillium malachiteum]|uniref:uncharacterized protein n=1 Tax=Penicillium malachiteum TaxID=1324776 RepID=UPI002546C934|nr:uncharacterized protein N7483_007689 [Penicillium malachiteum]KAJ5726332.1 hypothetical protein N7483_007689 [Penicillium malachiteum]
MATPNMQGQGRAGQNLPVYNSAPPNANSPLSPASGGNTPISFQPNVNRSKTKRWVEAKQYSYDGGDWGDEDEEEEEDEPPVPAAVPRPPYASQRTGSSSELSSRRLSGLMLGGENENRASPPPDQQKAAPFVRPADLYKRMREDKGMAGSPQTEMPPPSTFPAARNEVPRTEIINSPSEATQTTPTVGLPDIRRMSSFGADFLGDESTLHPTTIEPSEPSLQHNPSQASQISQASQGFTSVVHQAFDVPQTPNSTTGSVARSNSDGTSVISPIISTRGPHDDKTPTIPEEPAESNTPTGAPSNGPAIIPGHRRDMSLPERDNSPSKRPVVTEHDPPMGSPAEMASVSPGEPHLPQQSPQDVSPNAAEKDFVAPLKLGDRKLSDQSATEGYRGPIPTIIPATVMDESPEDGDSDRLREEIMRSLSREGSQEPEQIPHSQAGESRETSIPHQYEKYWDGQTGPSPEEVPRPLVSDAHPDWNKTHPLGSQDPYASNQASAEPPLAADEASKKPRLERRFSWESTSTATESTPQPAPASEDPLASRDEESATRAPGPVGGELPNYDSEGSQRTEKPRLSIVPPIPEGGITPPVQVMGPVDGLEPQTNIPEVSALGAATVDEKKLQGFRDILNLTSTSERTKAFDKTRDQFAVLNSGLNNWLQMTIHDHPEHADVVQSSQNPTAVHRNSPTRTRFPKLTSLGAITTSRDDATPTATSHIRRPSGNIGTIMNKSNVEQRGKEFLHTAGTFGGKAGEAAKGLFAKGRSKFRASGDKGQSSNSRSESFNFSPESNPSQCQSEPPKRNSLNLSSLPVFKFGQNRNPSAASADPNDKRNDTHSGKRLKSTGSTDILHSQTDPGVGPSGRAVSQPLTSADGQRSGWVGELEQEMISALGLSPTANNSQYDPLVIDGPTSSSRVPLERGISEQGQSQEAPLAPLPTSKYAFKAYQKKKQPGSHSLRRDKSLPEVPSSQDYFEAPVSPVSPESGNSEPAGGVSQLPILTIRPVVEVKPSDPPNPISKEIPPQDNAPPAPPKDVAHLKTGHAARQPSVSTLGIDERRGFDELDDDFDTPPSPLEPPSPEAPIPFYGSPIPEAKTSYTSVPSVEESRPDAEGVSATFTSRPSTSAQALDANQKSIGGLPPSAPNMQSPLRNEVRYSPATRSSMVSFGSWGNNGRGTRPTTPANELSSLNIESIPQAQNGESKREKLKGFGKRRRASVGDLLSGIQGGLQGLQQKIHQEPQAKEKGHQRKVTFGKISNLFTRSEPKFSETGESGRRKSMGNDLDERDLPRKSTDRKNVPNSQKIRKSVDKALPEAPPAEFTSSSRQSYEGPARQRASFQLSSGPSSNALAAGRFYSQSQATDSPSTAQHTRVNSMPLMSHMGQPLSPIAQSESDHNGSMEFHPHGLEDRISQENRWPGPQDSSGQTMQGAVQHSPSHEYDYEYEPSHPGHNPNLNIRSRKSTDAPAISMTNIEPRNVTVSGMSSVTYSEHPHRDESRTLTRNTQPVELALRDDTSDEIVMSPTAYPGQEWMPMQC